MKAGTWLSAALYLLAAGTAAAQSALPNPALTPGAVNPEVTQENIGETICLPGWAKSVRPPERYTETLKRRQIEEYGYANHYLSAYEEDHLVPLELGGSPSNPKNLWPEPHIAPGGWGSRRKDYLENLLHRLVCDGRVPLREAQRAIARNWIAAYQRYRAEGRRRVYRGRATERMRDSPPARYGTCCGQRTDARNAPRSKHSRGETDTHYKAPFGTTVPPIG